MQISGMILSYSRSVCVYYCSVRLYKKQLERLSKMTRVCVYMNYKGIFLYECYKYAPIWYCHLFAQSNHSSLFHSFVFRITTIFALHSFVNRSSENIICVRGYITTNILYINTQTNVNKIYTSIFFVTVALIWWNNN